MFECLHRDRLVVYNIPETRWPQPTNHGAQDDRAERERRVFIVTDVDKVLGNVSSAGNNCLPI